jgi:hypothetical protein
LEQRRLALAAADAAPDAAHSLPTLPFDTSGLEPFPLVTPEAHLKRWQDPTSHYATNGDGKTAFIPNAWKVPSTAPPLPPTGKQGQDHGPITYVSSGTSSSPTAYLLQQNDTAEGIQRMTSRCPARAHSASSMTHTSQKHKCTC